MITPYRDQVKLLREGLRCGGHYDVEVNTVDQYQGRDKSVIIISFVKLAKSSLPGVSSCFFAFFLYFHAWWLDKLTVWWLGRRTCDQQFVSSTAGHTLLD